MVFRRSLLESAGLFYTDCGAYADRFWAMKSALVSDTVFLREKLATWALHDGQSSRGASRRELKEVLGKTREFLEENSSDILRAWGLQNSSTERLFNRLAASAQHEYERWYCLDRAHIKSGFARFVCRSVLALMHEPALLFRRVRSGFAWDDVSFEHEARLLAEELNIPRPVGL